MKALHRQCLLEAIEFGISGIFLIVAIFSMTLQYFILFLVVEYIIAVIGVISWLAWVDKAENGKDCPEYFVVEED